LTQDSLPTTAVLACHAALPALDVVATAPAAVRVLEQAAKNLAGDESGDLPQVLQLALARHELRSGRVDEGKRWLKAYQDAIERNIPQYGGDYVRYARKEVLRRVAAEFVRAARCDDLLDALGQYADAPAYKDGDPPPGAALAGLARLLSALPSRERYELLRAWTLPTAGRKSVRLLASFAPDDAPPPCFGQFANPALDAGVAGTSTLLIRAAREAGTLDALADEAAKLAAEKVENAESLLVLVEVARGRGASVKGRLADRLARLRGKPFVPGPTANAPPVSWPDLLAARAALGDPGLRDEVGEPLALALLDRAERGQAQDMLCHLRDDLARARAARVGGSPGGDSGLALWHPTSLFTADTHASGPSPARWVAGEGVVAHLTGPQDQLLLLDVPLAGRFEFSVDAFVGGDGGGGEIAYGGLILGPGSNTVATVGRHEVLPWLGPAARPGAFSRLTVQVEPGHVRYLVNGRLAYKDDDPSPTSPWLALVSSREHVTAFANPTLSGAPAIPREVRLSHADRLDGWTTGFYGESQPTRRGARPDGSSPAPPAWPDDPPEGCEWWSRDGVIRGHRLDDSATNEPAPSRLRYHRPLRDGEMLSYEFYYEPGFVLAHPALGRLAFLLEPDGVRLHWLTDGPDQDWTGLPPDNLADEPASRRGPDRLPLKPGDWNAARLSLADGVVTLDLNGTTVYRRPLEPTNDRQFSLFRFKDRTAAQVRNVVLRGPWPTSLPTGPTADLMAPARP
jgi:hypothetical protein